MGTIPKMQKICLQNFLAVVLFILGLRELGSLRFSTEGGNNISQTFGDGTSASMPKKPPTEEIKLPCSLKEMYSGSKRKVKISRTVINTNGSFGITYGQFDLNVVDSDYSMRTVGARNRETINSCEARMEERDKNHLSRREANGLIVNYKMTLAEELEGARVNLVTLDGRSLSIPLNDIVSHGYELVVVREGMPIAKSAVIRVT